MYEHPQEDKSRLGGHSYIYSKICEQEYSRFVELNSMYEMENDELLQSEIEDEEFIVGVKTTL